VLLLKQRQSQHNRTNIQNVVISALVFGCDSFAVFCFLKLNKNVKLLWQVCSLLLTDVKINVSPIESQIALKNNINKHYACINNVHVKRITSYNR